MRDRPRVPNHKLDFIMRIYPQYWLLGTFYRVSKLSNLFTNHIPFISRIKQSIFYPGFTIWWVRVREDISDSDPVRGEEEKRLEVGGEVFSAVLRALSCGATYSVRAVAYSRAGASASSAPLLVRTKPPG